MRLFRRFRWRELPLFQKLILFYLPLIIVPVVVGMYVVTSNFNKKSRLIMEENTINLLDLVVEKLEQDFESFENLSLHFFVDADLHHLLQANPVTYIEKAKNRLDLERKVQILLNEYRPYIKSTVLTLQGSQYMFGNLNPASLVSDYEKFIQSIEEGEGSVFWELDTTAGGEKVVLLGRNINDIDRYNKIAQVIFVINPDIFKHTLEDTKISQSASFELYSPAGQIVIDAGKELVSAAGENNHLIIDVPSRRYNWTLKSIIPLEQMNKQLRATILFSIAVTALCVLLGLAVTQLIAMDVLIPIKKLMRNMKMGVKGVKPQQLSRFRGAKEVTELNDTFISVLYEIDQLNHAVMINQTKKQDMEMKILQSQISPHFLYNTLNSIRWMAILQKQNNIKDMADALNNLLSYSIRNPGELVTIEEEIDILGDYINIQKVRYLNFEFNLDIPEPIMRLKILKFLLQPIIENAVIHGLSEDQPNGEVFLKAYGSPEKLLIEISDNGIGMNAEKLSQVQNIIFQSKAGNHLGLRNIHERIQLHYGKKYGLLIQSEVGIGTTVILNLPWIEDRGPATRSES